MALNDKTAENMAKAQKLSDDSLSELAQENLKATRVYLDLLETYHTEATIGNFAQPEQNSTNS